MPRAGAPALALTAGTAPASPGLVDPARAQGKPQGLKEGVLERGSFSCFLMLVSQKEPTFA